MMMRNIVLRLFGIRVVECGRVLEVHLPRWVLWANPTFATDLVKRLRQAIGGE